MTVSTKSALQAAAEQIRLEAHLRANTAQRVGQALRDIVDSTSVALDVTTYGVSASASGADNDTNIAAAITAAVAADADLYWPAGTYTSAASLASLHSVRHRGPGRILRGSDTFYLEPKYGQTNRLYVATTGSASADGLSSSEPMVKPQDAFTAFYNYGPVLKGSWQVVLAAGTYTVHSQTMDVASEEWVVIKGPAAGHPMVPTAVFDGSGFASNQHGFIIGTGGGGTGVKAWFQDIKCQDYNAGASNSCGWSQGYAARCIYVNCHATNCDFAGILADQGDICLIKGGIIDNCRSGVVLNATKGTVGYQASTTADGTRISSCTQNGVYWSRGAQGHIDYCIFDQNPYHVVVESSARAHTLGNDYRRASTAAINTNTGGSYYDDVSVVNVYNDGTGNANAKRYVHNAYSGEQQTWLQASTSEMRRLYNDTTLTGTGIVKTPIASGLLLLPANWFADATKKIRVKLYGDVPAGAGTKIGVDFYNASMVPTGVEMDFSTVVGTAGASSFEYECTIFPSSLTVQRSFAKLDYSGGFPRIQTSSCAANMAVDQHLRVMYSVPTGVLTLRRAEVNVTG